MRRVLGAGDCRSFVHEVFKSKETLEDHLNTPHYQECVRRIDPSLTGSRTKQFFYPVVADFLAEA